MNNDNWRSKESPVKEIWQSSRLKNRSQPKSDPINDIKNTNDPIIKDKEIIKSTLNRHNNRTRNEYPSNFRNNNHNNNNNTNNYNNNTNNNYNNGYNNKSTNVSNNKHTKTIISNESDNSDNFPIISNNNSGNNNNNNNNSGNNNGNSNWANIIKNPQSSVINEPTKPLSKPKQTVVDNYIHEQNNAPINRVNKPIINQRKPRPKFLPDAILHETIEYQNKVEVEEYTRYWDEKYNNPYNDDNDINDDDHVIDDKN